MASHVYENVGKVLTETCDRGNCGKHFKDNFNLQIHLRIHDNNLIKCPFCPWGGVKHCAVSIHLITHFHYRPYSCQFCPFTFYTQEYINVHQDKVHSSLKDVNFSKN